ncbi:hypothetical protein [Methylomonas sp. MgM2]
MSFPFFDLEFTKNGRIFDQSQLDAILNQTDQFSDLIVMSHGWNNDMRNARALYDELSESLIKVLPHVPALQGRQFAVLRIFWPSKRFADAELIPGGGAASATQESDAALVRLLEELKRDPERLPEQSGDGGIDPERAAIIDRALAQIPSLDEDLNARVSYVQELRKLFDQPAMDADDGSDELFSLAPDALFDALQEPVQAPLGTRPGGANAVGDTGGAAGLGDLISGAKAAARRLANLFTYYTMKERSGTVGSKGLGPVLIQLRQRKANLKLHLAGHSFGGRLVTAAAHALPASTPNVSITLLQAAYSHNGLAENFDNKGHDGAFRAVIADKRASGPIVITHTHNDKAVGIAYPLASRIARDQASALGDKNDPYGGMGRNGAQHTKEAADKAEDMHGVGKPYDFQPGGIYNLKADEFIRDHSDVKGFQVAYALLNAVKAL